jgi:hypothetical protein
VHLNLRKTREKKATIPRKFRRESIKQADLRNLASLSTTKACILFGNAARESFSMAYTIGALTVVCGLMRDNSGLMRREGANKDGPCIYIKPARGRDREGRLRRDKPSTILHQHSVDRIFTI